MSSSSLEDIKYMFLCELKKYNANNYRALLHADLSEESPIVHKACSSVVTRYFIFTEKHPEIPEDMLKMLYYKLKIDTIARYFSEYPASSLSDLHPFQEELKRHAQKVAEEHEMQKMS